MERQHCGSNRDPMSRRISYQNEEELGIGNKGDGRSIENNEEVI